MITNCSQLKIQSSDEKLHKTNIADTEQLLRLIQSIPSPKEAYPPLVESISTNNSKPN